MQREAFRSCAIRDGEAQIILPIWHQITKDELLRLSPSLTGKIALRTADSNIDEIADEIAEAVAAARDS